MNAFARAAVVGFALANLYLLDVTGPLVSPQHELVFHLTGSANRLFVPAILDVVLVWALLAGVLRVVSRAPRLELLLWSTLLLAIPSGLLSTIYGFGSKPVPVWLRFPLGAAAVLAWIHVNAGWRRVLPQFIALKPLFTTLLGFLALPELLLFLHLVWYGYADRHLNPSFMPAPRRSDRSAAEVAAPRVLWIILDELAYDQVFSNRLPGLQLPNFDRLAAESAVFTNARPTAEYTRIAVPSLLTGEALRSAQPTADGRSLILTEAQTGRRSTFAAQDTIFGDVQEAGLPTAIAGWYEPYCRLLPGVLNRCFWIYSDELPAGRTGREGLLRGTIQPFLHFAQLTWTGVGLPLRQPIAGKLDVDRHRADYQALLTASDRLLQPASAGLTLVHMPIPHPWGFYDRRTGSFPEHQTSYIDNLVLADQFLGRVRAQLEAQQLWDSTDVLVMGDHSWRTTRVWSSSTHWTPEEQAASHGGAFDDRPAVLLKLAHQHSGITLDRRFNAVHTRALINALLRKHLQTPDALRQWLATQ